MDSGSAGLEQVTPDLLVEPTLSLTTVAVTRALGVLVVALAPLLGVRRELRMDVPGRHVCGPRAFQALLDRPHPRPQASARKSFSIFLTSTPSSPSSLSARHCCSPVATMA